MGVCVGTVLKGSDDSELKYLLEELKGAHDRYIGWVVESLAKVKI